MRLLKLSLIILLLSSCGLFKKRIVYKTDSVFIDKTKIETVRLVDTIVTLASDTNKYSFKQPLRDTSFTLQKGGNKVEIEYKNGVYYIASINAAKKVPIKIYEKKIEYRDIYSKSKSKYVEKKSTNFSLYLFIFLIISIIVTTLVLKSKIKQYVQTKIKFW